MKPTARCWIAWCLANQLPDMTDSELEKVIKVLERCSQTLASTFSNTQGEANRHQQQNPHCLAVQVQRWLLRTAAMQRSTIGSALPVKRMAANVASLSWLRGDMVISVLESLKQWHLRERCVNLWPRHYDAR